MKHSKKFLVFMLITTVLVIWIGIIEGQKKVEVKLLKEKTFSDDVLSASFEEENGELLPRVLVTKSGIEFIDKKGLQKNRKVFSSEAKKMLKYGYSKNKKVFVYADWDSTIPIKHPNNTTGAIRYTVVDIDGNVLPVSKDLWTEEESFAMYLSDDGKVMYMPAPGIITFSDRDGKWKEVKLSNEGSYIAAAGGVFSDDGRYFVFHRGYSVVLYDMQELKEVWTCLLNAGNRPNGRICISPNNEYICATAMYQSINDKWLWSFSYCCINKDGQILWSKEEDYKLSEACGNSSIISFSPDSKYLVLTLPYNKICVVKVATGVVKWTTETNSNLNFDTRLGFVDLKLSDEGKYLLASVGPGNGFISNKHYNTRYVWLFDDNGNKVWTKELDGSSYLSLAGEGKTMNDLINVLWEKGTEIIIDRKGTQFTIINGKQLYHYSIQHN